MTTTGRHTARRRWGIARWKCKAPATTGHLMIRAAACLSPHPGDNGGAARVTRHRIFTRTSTQVLVESHRLANECRYCARRLEETARRDAWADTIERLVAAAVGLPLP